MSVTKCPLTFVPGVHTHTHTQDAPKAIEALKALDVPYLCSLPLVFQTTEEWLKSELGVHPVQVALQVIVAVLVCTSGAPGNCCYSCV